jgi:hypothetical protein
MEYLMHFPKVRRVLLPILAGGAFLLIVFFAYAAVKLWRDDVNSPDDPVPMSVEEAIDRSRTEDDVWVALQDTSDFRWDCRTMVQWSEESSNKKWMDIIVTNPLQSIVLVVTLKEVQTCDELMASHPALSGELSRLTGRDFNDYNYEGRFSQYPASATYLEICTYCSPHQSPAFIALSLFCLVGSVIMTGYFLREFGKTRKLIADRARDHYTYPEPDYSGAEERLMSVFCFTTDHLAANRMGYMTPDQKNRLMPKWYKLVGSVVGLVLMGLAMIAGGTIGVMGDADIDHKTVIAGKLFIAAVLIIGIPLDTIGTLRVRRGRVSDAYGAVMLKTIAVGDTVEYCAVVSGTTFTIGPEQYAALIENRPYHFYYIGGLYGYSRGKVILSVCR